MRKEFLSLGRASLRLSAEPGIQEKIVQFGIALETTAKSSDLVGTSAIVLSAAITQGAISYVENSKAEMDTSIKEQKFKNAIRSALSAGLPVLPIAIELMKKPEDFF